LDRVVPLPPGGRRHQRHCRQGRRRPQVLSGPSRTASGRRQLAASHLQEPPAMVVNEAPATTSTAFPLEDTVRTLLFRLGGAAAEHPWRVISTWLCILAAIFTLSLLVGGSPRDDYNVPGSP